MIIATVSTVHENPSFLPETFAAGVVMTLVFGFLGIFFLLGGFKLFDWMLPKVDFQESMKASPVACAIVVASFFISLAYIIAQVIQ